MNTSWLRRIRHLFRRKAIVLMYHRIADLEIDPWELAVSPENFEEQLKVLKQWYKAVPVNELVTQLHSGSITHKSVCLTFDDGYRDNYLFAKPLLEKYQCPAVFYIPTQYIGQEKKFWWDELQEIILTSGKLPQSLSVMIDKEQFEYTIDHEAQLTPEQWNKHKVWVWPVEPPTRRCGLYLALWEKLKPLPYLQIQLVLNHIKTWAAFNQAPGTEDFPMTGEQLANLTDHPWITTGIHTVSHPALSFHSKSVQQDEITTSRLYLDSYRGKPSDSIAFPYGDYNDLTLSVVQEQQLKAAFTTEAISVTSKANPFRLGRFQVKNWSGHEFAAHLSRWIKEY